MIGFLVRRFVLGFVVILIVSFAIFVLARMVPTSPAFLVLGGDAGADQIAAFEAQYGLDRPVIAQYLTWVAGLLGHLDFGVSYVSGRPVAGELLRTLPVTLELIVVSMILCLIISIPLGVISASFSGGVVDHTLRIFSVLGVSTPGFWLGLVLILLFSVKLGWLPPGDLPPITEGLLPHLRALVLPSFCLAIYYTAIISRMTRSSVLDVLGRDYVRTAVAMGLSKWRIWLVYVLKNALIPIVSVAAMACGYMFGWALVIEQVFNLPGVCRALLTAIFSRDYNVVQGAVLVVTTAFVLLNFIADAAFRFLNPRVSW